MSGSWESSRNTFQCPDRLPRLCPPTNIAPPAYTPSPRFSPTESMAVRQKIPLRRSARFMLRQASCTTRSLTSAVPRAGALYCPVSGCNAAGPDSDCTGPCSVAHQLPQFCFRPVRKFRDGDAIYSRSRWRFLPVTAFINPVPSGLRLLERSPCHTASTTCARLVEVGRSLPSSPQSTSGSRSIPAEDIFRFPNPVFLVSALNSAPCVGRSHLNSCVPFPRRALLFSSSFSRPVLHRQGFGTMDALTPLPTGLPACEWPHRFGLRRFCPDARAPPRFGAFWSPGAYSGTSGHPLGRGLLGSPPRFFRTAQPGTTWGRPRRYGSLSRPGWGLPHGGQLGHAFPRPYPPVQPLGLQLSSLPSGPPHLPSRERTASRLPRP